MPALDVLLVGLVALLIVFTWQSWTVKVLQAMKAQAPGLFGPLFDALIGADNAIYNALRGWTDNAIQPFTDLVNRAIAAIEALTGGPLAFARAAYAAIQRLFTVEIPNAIQSAEATARQLLAGAEQAAQALFEAAQQGLTSLAAQLASLAQRADLGLAQLGDLVASNLHQALDYALDLAQRGAHYAASLVGLEAERALAAEQALQDAAGAGVQSLESELGSEVARVESQLGALAHGLEAEVEQARRQLGAEIVNFEDLTKQRIAAVIESSPFVAALALSEAGKRALGADVETLVTLTAAEIRKQLGDAESLRARFGPEVRAALDRLHKVH